MLFYTRLQDLKKIIETFLVFSKWVAYYLDNIRQELIRYLGKEYATPIPQRLYYGSSEAK
jgi:hypothetical protein